jgi:hypothetical protein
MVEGARSSVLAFELGHCSRPAIGLKDAKVDIATLGFAWKRLPTEAALHAAQQFAARFIYQVAPSRDGNAAEVLARVLQQFSSTADRDSIRSDKLHKLRRQPLPLQQLRHQRLPRGARPPHGKRHRDRHHHGRRQHGQLQRLFDMRRRRLRQSRYTRC